MNNSIQEKNINKTVGTLFEYLPFDGTKVKNVASIWNYGISRAQGDIVVIIPDDVYFMKYNWGNVLENKFSNPEIAAVGVAGTQYMFSDTPSITAAGRPFTKGRIIYHLQNGDFFAVVYSQELGDFEVVACEGVFLAIRASLFAYAWFDEEYFDGEFLADTDLCMQLRKCGKLIVTTDIVVKKGSTIQFDNVWREYGKRFLEKWSGELPASCVNITPDRDKYLPGQCVDLHGKAPIATIC